MSTNNPPCRWPSSRLHVGMVARETLPKAALVPVGRGLAFPCRRGTPTTESGSCHSSHGGRREPWLVSRGKRYRPQRRGGAISRSAGLAQSSTGARDSGGADAVGMPRRRRGALRWGSTDGSAKKRGERETRFELATSCLEGRRSTAELLPHALNCTPRRGTVHCRG